MDIIEKWFDKLEFLSLRLSQVAVVIMMLLTTADAISRYFLKQSIIGAYETIELYLMVALVFLSMSFVQKIDGHIRLDILFDRFPKRVQDVLNIVYYVFAAVMFFFIGLKGFNMTLEAFQFNYVAAGLINLPLWLSYIWIPIGSFLFVIRLLLLALLLVIGKGKYSETDPSDGSEML